MIRFPRSIRWRVQLWYAALLAAMLCGFGLSAFHLEKERRYREVDAALQARLSVLVDALRAGPDRGGERPRTPELRFSPAQAALFDDAAGHYFAVWMQAAKPIATSRHAPPFLPKPGPREDVVRTRGEWREAFIFAAPVNCALVGRSVAPVDAELRTFAVRLTLAGAAVLGAALLVGSRIVSRALRPVDEISATAARIATGDLSQRIPTADTHSELGKLAGVLNSTFSRLETAFAQQAQFTADAAHELRTPVSVMLTQVQSALVRERSASEYRETLQACERATQRMRRLIESLLELARLDAGQELMRREPCDLSTITADCIELIRPLAGQRNIRIDADLSAARFVGDAERVAQVLTNLLTNATEYNNEGGEIDVSTSQRDGIAILSITNSGPSIPPEELPHIFERFRRADKARTPGHSGLGLAISKAIVEAHGGSIVCASDADRRVRFVVRLPG